MVFSTLVGASVGNMFKSGLFVGLVIAAGLSIGALISLYVVPVVYTFVARSGPRVAPAGVPSDTTLAGQPTH